MKRLYSYIGSLLIGVLVLSSCQEAASYENSIYFTGSEESNLKRLSAEEPTAIGLSVTAADIVDSKVTVHAIVDDQKVDEYNKKEGTKYLLLPKESYKLSETDMTIEVGDNVSKPLELLVWDIDKIDPQEKYLLPLTLTDVKGGLKLLESSKTMYILVSRPFITSAANITYTSFRAGFDENEKPMKLNQVSYEARFKVNSFQESHPYISTVLGIEGHFLLRFGDVSIKPNQIQIAGDDVHTTAPTEFVTDKWYHVAAVYDGSSVNIYINGKLDVSKAASVPFIDLRDEAKSRGFYIGFSEGGRYFDGAISEVRVWSKALTQKEIVNNMCGADPKSDGLVAYWKFNEGEGTHIQDFTGHGWDMTGSNDFEWIQGVRCPEE